MYNNNGNLDYAGINLWGAIAIIGVMICGCAIAIVKMFSIVKHFLFAFLQIRNGFRNHFDIFFKSGFDNVRYM